MVDEAEARPLGRDLRLAAQGEAIEACVVTPVRTDRLDRGKPLCVARAFSGGVDPRAHGGRPGMSRRTVGDLVPEEGHLADGGLLGGAHAPGPEGTRDAVALGALVVLAESAMRHVVPTFPIAGPARRTPARPGHRIVLEVARWNAVRPRVRRGCVMPRILGRMVEGRRREARIATPAVAIGPSRHRAARHRGMVLGTP